MNLSFELVEHLRPLTPAILVAMLLVASAAAASDLPAYTPDSNAARAQIPSVYRWDLSPLFASDEAWEQARTRLLSDMAGLASFEGKLAEPASLRACLELYFRLHTDANRVTLYPNLRQSTAVADDAAGAMVQKSLAAMEELMRSAAFIRREVLALPATALDAACAAEPGLSPYRAYLTNLRRRSSRTLSPDAERALALLGDNLWAELDLNEIPSPLEDAYSALLADIPWPRVKDERGQEVQLNLANYQSFRRSPDRGVRRAAVTAFLGTLRQYQHALAATLAGQVKLDIAYAQARSYDTAIDAYLDKDDVAPAVYDNLVRKVNANLPLLHRYVSLRKKLLGLPDVHLYDLYIPLVPGTTDNIPFAEARATILEALKPLGPEYGAVLAKGLDPGNGWLDLYPHEGKRSGAFSSSAYGRHPYVFMNYQDSLDDLGTLAHEYGHALHSHLAMTSQPAANFRYVTLLAEIASTCNEALLNDHLVASTSDPARKAYLLVGKLEDIRTTIFRQTMFAQFERKVHELAEAGTPVTATLLDETYSDLVRAYYGPDYVVDADDGMEWGYIPHFYYKYYVYSYATGLASGIAIAERVRESGAPAVDAYLGMLKGGSAEPPLELLKEAGVDLSKPDAIEASMRAFSTTLDEVERLLAK